MIERKYIKFRVDMYEDTKFKIIDKMVKRDLIHYVWNRSVLLAGKVNREGDLYMSKNIPYKVETLAIEFNRDIDEIKAALDVLIELEMMELTEDNVYRVKNFAKHQNIKIKEKTETKEKIKNKEKIESKDKENDIAKNNAIENEVYRGETENEAYTEKNKETNEQLNKFDVMPLLDYVPANSDGVNKSNDNKEKGKTSSSKHNNSPVILEMKKNKKTSGKSIKANKKKISDEIIEMDEDNLLENTENIEKVEEKEEICSLIDGEEFSLKEGETLVSDWSFK